MSFSSKTICLLISVVFFLGCKEPKESEYTWKSIKVTATAYNSLSSQTSGQPNITAWGDTLKPGMQCIAVSRDLIRLGLKHNTQVKIEGLEGIFIVNDKMNKKWRKRIDIYTGVDVTKAKEWGRKKKKIHYRIKVDSVNIKTN